MTPTPHPLSRDRIANVANEHDVDEAELDEALGRVQHELERTDETYEYSSHHNYGWQDDEAFYCYGTDGLWERLEQECSFSGDLRTAVYEVHYRKMVESASENDRTETVEETLSDGDEPLVLANTAEGPALYGQDV